MITVTRPWLPDKSRLDGYIQSIYDSGYITNKGPLVQELECRLTKYLNVKHLILVNNGTSALQVAYRALGIQGEVITTPFSFVATSSSLLWQDNKPIFADIAPKTFNISAAEVEAKITKKTSGIVPVHVFGNPCEVEAIENMANQHDLKVVYDGSHAFGSQYKGQSVLSYGDISTLSFHATKLFHTIEGGAIITSDDKLAEKVRLMINHGIANEESTPLCGINAKMNEFSAAMGLCVLDDIEIIKSSRKNVWNYYQNELEEIVGLQQWSNESNNNYAYAPIILSSETQLLKVKSALNLNGIMPRRYFYPSLDNLPFLGGNPKCEVSNDIAQRILCLPIYPTLEKKQYEQVVNIIKSNL